MFAVAELNACRWKCHKRSSRKREYADLDDDNEEDDEEEVDDDNQEEDDEEKLMLKTIPKVPNRHWPAVSVSRMRDALPIRWMPLLN